MKKDEILFAIKYYLTEPFMEVWEMRHQIIKPKFWMGIFIIIMVVSYFINNRLILGISMAAVIILYFWNRIISGDHKHAMREKYKERIRRETE